MAFAVIGFINEVYEFFTQDIDTIVRETLRAMGLPWEDSDTLDVAGFTGVVSRMSGIRFTDLSSVEAIKNDVIGEAGNRMETATGFRPTTLEPEALKAEFIAWLTASIVAEAEGHPTYKLGQMARHVAQDAKRLEMTDYARLGWHKHLQRHHAREAGKRYRETHKKKSRLESIWLRKKIAGKWRPWKLVATKKKVWGLWKKNQKMYTYAIENDVPQYAASVGRWVPLVPPANWQYARSSERRKLENKFPDDVGA